MKCLAWLAAPAVLLLASAVSAAPTKSFVAASAALPADIEVVGTSNVKAVRSTEVWKQMFPALLKLNQEIPDGIDKLKKSCGIDPVTAFDDVTVGVDASDEAGIFIAMNGLTETKVVECLTKIAKSEGETVTTKKSGTITEVKSGKSGKSVFFAWLPGDVAVFTSDPDDKALLEKMVGGKGAIARSRVGSRLSRISSDAALSAVWGKEMPIDKMTVKGGDATIIAQGGNMSLATTLEMASGSEASQLAKMANMISTLAPMPKNSPKELEKIVGTLSAKSSGSEVKLTAQASEQDLVTVIKWALARGGTSSSKKRP